MLVERYMFTSMWAAGGLWLADMPAVAAMLEGWFGQQPKEYGFRAPKSETLRVWKSELKLRSYTDSGRLVFDQDGNAVPDGKLMDEAASALKQAGVAEDGLKTSQS